MKMDATRRMNISWLKSTLIYGLTLLMLVPRYSFYIPFGHEEKMSYNFYPEQIFYLCFKCCLFELKSYRPFAFDSVQEASWKSWFSDCGGSG